MRVRMLVRVGVQVGVDLLRTLLATLHVALRDRDPGDERDEDRERDQADGRVAEVEATVGRLAEAVSERGAERSRHDVGEPEREDRVPVEAPPADGRNREHAANSSAEGQKPRLSWHAVRSPAAVPSANVPSTAAQ